MRVLACVLVAAFALVPSAAATPRGLKLVVRDGNHLSLVYLDRAAPFVQPLTPARGALQFSGDGRLISIGATIVGRTTLPGTVVWAPTGERAAAVTKKGGVVAWTPAGRRTVISSGAETIAWSADGALAIGKGAYVFVWRNGKLRRVAGPAPFDSRTGGPGLAMPFAWSGDNVLWWAWPGSGSIASDGVTLWEDGKPLGTMLMYREWLAACGSHVAFAAGLDRESMHGKKIVFDGRVVSGGPALSWASPSCTAAGRLVAAASRNRVTPLTYETHRAIWQLLPARRQLTRPPWGWSDEDPRLFPNGDLLFVRTRARSTKTGPSSWTDRQTGKVMLLSHGKLVHVATIGFTQPDDVYTYPVQFYGHYDWSQFLAVWP